MTLHPVVRWLARRAIRWFYGKAEWVNAEAIPASGPTLLVVSHGNDLPDILQTFLATDRDILFVANISAADFPPVRWTYAGLGVIPVSRVRDARALKARGEDANALNANAFVRVIEALKQGHCVAIFPEGVVPDFPRLGALRSGAAKMALQAIDSGVTSLQMVPIGYQYERAPEPRSGALCMVGNPVRVAEWNAEEPTKRVTEFTDFIRDALQSLTRNARTERDVAVLATVSAVVGAAISSNTTSPIAAAHQAQRALSKLSAADGIFVADSVAPSAIEWREPLFKLQQAALELSHVTATFGARSWSARDQADVLNAAGDTNVAARSISSVMLLLTAPLAVVGWLWHAVPWFASYAIAKKFAPRNAEFAAIVLVPGLYIVVVWYLFVPALLLMSGVTPWLALFLFLVQPRLGDFALGWRDWWRRWRLMSRVRAASSDQRYAIRTLGASLRGKCETFRDLTAR